MSELDRFVDLAVGGFLPDPSRAFDDFVARWHESGSDEEIHEWLGLTAEEYALIVEKPAWIRAVLMARVSGIPLRQAVLMASDAASSLAARGIPQSEIPKIREWLRETGRL
ncbi:MAG TPA: hypothetical protein VHB79_30540 [Polyangiaceae bacterium]|nr:hypothetical protein [Polyangiaceae bacterium]